MGIYRFRCTGSDLTVDLIIIKYHQNSARQKNDCTITLKNKENTTEKFVAVGVDDLSDFHKQGMRTLAREPMAS